jgi:hypothetical protein
VRIGTGQYVRPDGTVLTEQRFAEQMVPGFGYHWRDAEGPFAIMGETYGRWRWDDEGQWRVVWYWPDGPHRMPGFWDNTGEGHFLPMDPASPVRPRDETAQQLRSLA